MKYEKIFSTVLKDRNINIPLWFKEWKGDYYYINIKDDMINIVVPTRLHESVFKIIESVIYGAKCSDFFDVTQISLPIEDGPDDVHPGKRKMCCNSKVFSELSTLI